ncbi:DgyrCDS2375 [Dimorphilus gyrociliatus]|uniref:DgyrCDS2375 n=1 Tax=Dimorphilus gyrociliatus TaxID=2664684 RepID=A0A7I8VBX0_9ANNE|nr:DgyrCDS2375 [Dimorphilus gyrociliatus]
MAVCLAFAFSLVLLCRRQRARRGSLLPASLSSQQTQVSYSPIRQPCHVARSGDGEGFSHDPSDVVVDDGARFPTVIAPPNVKAEDAPPPYSRIPVVNTTRHNSLSGLRRSRPEEPPRSNSVSVGSPPPYRA